MPTDPNSGVYYELHGQGEPLIVGFPVQASQADIFGEFGEKVISDLLSNLSDRYRILLMDYPSIGKSVDMDPVDFTMDRACADILSVADHAGFERFAWWGYTVGGAIGLQLAMRTDRLTALVMGACPPIDAPYETLASEARKQMQNPPEDVRVILRSPEQYAQWVYLYESVAPVVKTDLLQVKCPALAFAGENGDVGAGEMIVRNASILVERRNDLESLGWKVILLPGEGHEVGLKMDVLAPVIGDFLDGALSKEK